MHRLPGKKDEGLSKEKKATKTARVTSLRPHH